MSCMSDTCGLLYKIIKHHACNGRYFNDIGLILKDFSIVLFCNPWSFNLIKLDICHIFFFHFCHSLASSNIPFWRSYHAAFHSFMTIQSYSRQLNILTNMITALLVYSVLIPRHLVSLSLIGQLKYITLRWIYSGCQQVLVRKK